MAKKVVAHSDTAFKEVSPGVFEFRDFTGTFDVHNGMLSTGESLPRWNPQPVTASDPSPSNQLNAAFSPQRIREMLAQNLEAQQTATEACATRRDWPQYRSISVRRVMGQLDILRETLPAITSSDIFPKETQGAVALAAEMLGDYAVACDTVENDDRRKDRATISAYDYNRGVLDERCESDRRMDDVLSSETYREGVKVIAERQARKARRERAKGKAKR